MRRSPLLLAATLAAACSAAPANAQVNELGTTRDAPLVAPSCPKNVLPKDCTIILTQVTALETIRAGRTYPTTVKSDGVIVAFTVGLSSLSDKRKTALADIRYLDRAYGGTTQAGITVLKPIGAHKKYTWQVVAQSPVFHLQPYLGQVVQFPLQSPITVTRGETVALTVPTWAPVLSINQDNSMFAYRQSRRTGCASPPVTSAAQQSIGGRTKYACNYPGTRVEYSVTEITNPKPTPHYVH